MSTLHRFGLTLAVAALLTALALHQTAASNAPQTTNAAAEAKAAKERDSEITDGLTVPTDAKAARALKVAEGSIHKQDWEAAIEILQGILDQEDNSLVRLTRKDENGEVRVEWVSRHRAADRLIGAMPAKGLEVYEQTFGAEAASLLDEAKKKKNDQKRLADVALKYQHTQAGAEAINLVGTYHLDRGEYVTADRCFAALLAHHTADQLKPITLFKAALAFRHAHDADNGRKAWKRLAAKVGKDGLRVGNRTLSVDELRRQLDRVRAEQPQQGGGPPYLDEMQWQQPTIRESQTKTWVEQGVQSLEQVGQPVLPAFFPITATARTDAGRVPLVMYRSYWGVHAIDLKTGKLYWESILPSGIDVLVKDSQKMGVLKEWWKLYKQTRSQSILFENSTLGMISTDGTRVYAVDDLALPPHPKWLQEFQWGGRLPFGPMEPAVRRSKLVAVELASGKLLWEQGGPDGDQDLADTFFLGPPLPLGGKLYVLTEKRTELRLICLDPRKKGAISWIQLLADVRDGLDKDVSRRIQAARLAYSEGILVCPTNAGAIVGVDVLSHGLVWAYAYRKPATNEGANNERMVRPRGAAMNSPITSPNQATPPIIRDGKVVFAAPGGHAVYCLDVRTGALLWTSNKRDDLYVGGVYNGKALVVGKSACRALSLADGKQLWREQTGLPSGQGVASHNVYYLPLKSGTTSRVPEVCAIDANTGRIIGHSKVRPDRDGKRPVPGNLLFVDGDVISQSVDTVTAYEQLEKQR
ncbi:MAG TPA: PQQ-binding-like beta-propeller repeat protein [Gemmataceae bacterium]|jgi:outer membrane protein assembly factor BamB|nr:PQQ-binding-like beta-propeller repeat protein [Gemmataceae bacterium]